MFLEINTSHLTSIHQSGGDILSNCQVGYQHYFTAPAVKPCTIYFCSARKPFFEELEKLEGGKSSLSTILVRAPGAL